MIRARPPSDSTSPRAPSSPARPRASSAMAYPRRANAWAVARPTPAEPPVITTTGWRCDINTPSFESIDMNERESATLVSPASQMRRRFRQHDFERWPNVRLDEMPAVGASVRFAQDHVSMHLGSVVADRHVPGACQHFRLLRNRDVHVLPCVPSEVRDNRIRERADRGELAGGEMLPPGELEQTFGHLITGIEDHRKGSLTVTIEQELRLHDCAQPTSELVQAMCLSSGTRPGCAKLPASRRRETTPGDVPQAIRPAVDVGRRDRRA